MTLYLAYSVIYIYIYILTFFLAKLSGREEEERTTVSRFHQGCPLLHFLLLAVVSGVLYLTLYLAYLLPFYLAYLLTFFLAFYLAYLLTFYLAYLLTFFLTFFLAFY